MDWQVFNISLRNKEMKMYPYIDANVSYRYLCIYVFLLPLPFLHCYLSFIDDK